MRMRNVLVALVFVAALLLRFYNYEDRITFGPEQAMSLITSGRMVTDEFTLLGNQNLQRQTPAGHSLFSGALFSYSLIPLQLIFSYDALPITVYFTLLNIATGAAVYLIAKKMLGYSAAIFSTILFLFFSVSVYHSLFIWNQNYLFLIGIVSIYLLHRLRKGGNYKHILYLGVLSGVGYSVQDLYVFTSLFVLGIILYYHKERSVAVLFFALGMIIPNLPAIIFDFRHDFYHLITNYEYAAGVFRGNATDASLKYYQFLHFVPAFALLGGYALDRLYGRSRVPAVVVTLAFVLINLSSGWIVYDRPTGMPADLTLGNIYRAAGIIYDDSPETFNVAVLVDFDTRGHVLRYPLEFKYGIAPMGVHSYPYSDNLYVLAENDYDFESSGVWELSSFTAESKSVLGNIGENYSVFKLTKN